MCLGIAAGVYGAKDEVRQIGPDKGGSVPFHQHDRILAKCPRQRTPLFRFDHQQGRIPKLVLLIPERNMRPDRRSHQEARKREAMEEEKRSLYAAGKLSLDVNEMRERLQRKGLIYE
ncbi:hypothetical protein LJN214_001878 [Mesorhizobium sp. LjNodule214]